MPAASGFLTALGQMFQGYGIDQKNRDLNADRDEARKNAFEAKQAAQEAKMREDALKGIRSGAAPNQGLITDAGKLAGSFAGPLGGIGVQGAMQDDPETFARDRFQQVTPSSYLDRTATPDAIARRKQEIAAQLQEKRDAMRQAAASSAKTEANRRAFNTLRTQFSKDPLSSGEFNDQVDYVSGLREAAANTRQDRTLSAAAQRAEEADQRSIVPIETTNPDGTKTQRYVTKSEAARLGMAPPTKGGGHGSAQSAMALQRLGMSAGDVEHAIAAMEAFENDPKMRAKLTASQQAMGSASQVVPDDHAHGALGVLNNAAGSLMSSSARQYMDKDLQQYMRNKQLVGLAFTEALPRPNQALLGMEKGLSGIDAGGFTDPIIKDVQSRRRMGLEQLHNAMGVLQGTTVGQPNTAPLLHTQPQQGSAAAAPRTYTFGGVTYHY